MRLYEIRYTNPLGIEQFAIISQSRSTTFLTQLETEGSVIKGMKRITGREY